MRRLILALWLASLGPFAAAQESSLQKKVSVKYENQPATDVLRDLGVRAGVRFDLADAGKLLDDYGPVTFAAEDQEVGRLANRIVRPRRYRLELAEGGLVRLVRLDALDEFKAKREQSFEFADKPKITRQGDKVTIAFQTKGFCDATVAVENAEGRIVRHLASGVLGDNAPEPFQWNSKKQLIVWDGKNDTAVYVGSDAWQPAFLSNLATQGLGSATYGYAIPAGSGQSTTLPWINLDQVSVSFDQPIAASSLQQASMALVGTTVPTYTMSAPVLSADGMTITWTITGGLGDDRLELALAGVANGNGTQMDGSWSNGASSFPSGNGTAGSAFDFTFNVLPGDVNASGSVDIVDTVSTRNRQFTAPGSANYSPFYDVNGDGSISIVDTIDVRNRQFTSLPSGTPSLPQSAGLVSVKLPATTAASPRISTPVSTPIPTLVSTPVSTSVSTLPGKPVPISTAVKATTTIPKPTTLSATIPATKQASPVPTVVAPKTSAPDPTKKVSTAVPHVSPK